MAVSRRCRLASLVPVLLIAGAGACASADRPTAPRFGPEFAISDGAHGSGTPGFYFLPPVVAQPTFSGSFDADITTLDPQIAICDITNGPDNNCGGASGTSAVIVFTTTSTPAITVDLTTSQYQVKWDTRAAGFVAGNTYRVHVTAGASGARRELGFADVLLTTTPGQVKNVATGDLIVLKDGRPLPIHFRIEGGIAGSVSVSAATPSVPTGGTDLLTATVQDLHGAPLVGATVAWTVTAAQGVVASLEPTSGPTTLLTAGTTPGTAVVAATSAGVSATATVAVTGGVAGKPLYVANQSGSITVYAAGASGNATPMATIAGANTGLNVPVGIALDGAGNIYVTNNLADQGIITVYAAGASGNATPTATIETGGIPGVTNLYGIALDGAGNIYVTKPGPNFSGGSITVYAAGASGNATPVATIAGDNTGLNFPLGIALDGAGNIYVTNWGTNSITVYAAGASGNATPTATITSAGLIQPRGIALDGAGNIYVASQFSNSITVYAAGASGNATPTATIAGGNTGLFSPVGIALDAAGNIYVTSANVNGGNSIMIYAAGASGNATPTATIFGGNTGLGGPALITF